MNKHKLFLFSGLSLLCSGNLYSQIVIDVNFEDIDAGGVGGSGLTLAQQAVFETAANTWGNLLTGYQQGVVAPNSIIINASAPAIDGAGGVLGSAGPNSTFSSGGFTFAATGSASFDSADLASLEADGTLEAVILHEFGHILGIGTLWQQNGLYVSGSGQYTGANALRFFQRDFDPTATFVEVEEETGSPGSDGGHWNQRSNDGGSTPLLGINPATSYFGESFDDELLTFSLSSLTPYISDVTLGGFIDLGYTVNLEVADRFEWDAGGPTANGTIESADGIWDETTANWSSDAGATNSTFATSAAAIFSDTGSTVSIVGDVTPSELIFEVDGYTLTGGSISNPGEIEVSVENAADTATFDTTITGAGQTLTLSGEGTVINTGTIERDVNLDAGSLTNDGTIEGDTTLAVNTVLNASADGFADDVILTNSGTVNLTGNDTIAEYISSGGTLEGTGTLEASSYNLSNGSIIDGNLGGGDLNISFGSVAINGSASANTLDILSGATLTTAANALAGNPVVTNAGTLSISGDQTITSYDGSGGGTLTGNGILTTDSLIGGTIETTATGVNQLSLLVDVNGGTVTLGAGSTLNFNLDSGVSIPAISEFALINNFAAINGDATSIGFESFGTSGLPSSVRGLFDVSTGNVILINLGESAGGSTNSANIFAALLGGIGNQTFANIDGFDSNVLDLAIARAALDPNDNITLASELQEISPEVYGGVNDYALRSHLSLVEQALHERNHVQTSERSSVFGGANGFSFRSDSSINDADYTLESTGGYIGAMATVGKSDTKLGILLGADQGDISGSRLDLEADGVIIGAFSETAINMAFDSGISEGVLKTSLSYSDHSFDGTRIAQGLANNVDDISTKVLQLGINYRAELFEGRNYKVTPFVGANYLYSTTDEFSESTSLNSISVTDEITKSLFLVETGLDGLYTPLSDNWGFTGSFKVQHNLGDDEADIRASIGGSPATTVSSPGLSGTSLEGRLGLFFKVTKASTVRLSAFRVEGEDFGNSSGASFNWSLNW